MCDVDERDAHLALQPLQLVPHLLAQLQVQRGQRLVEEQHGRAIHERARERDALLLPAGQLIWTPLLAAVEPHHTQRRRDRGADVGTRAPAHSQAKSNVLLDGHVGKERVLLEHRVDVAAMRRDARCQSAAEAHIAGVGRREPSDDAQCRGLPAPAGAEE